ncbi:hypothetical protein SODALDRAFT_291136 [Sodiomyces alkalinus F11]|uniref:Interferon-induced GTP-binding protein Mx n=1 Tax=Sodiomyces alkalinus (strain CBS 110278 / VKM F-3762 / F11) TaxID=1314773 RepID=A0A3N2Q223_SODAK|nr:hypothetical protein SODALDRAFT_291136 [Sodiomyces alkalinus F11]ROT40756.1 hypothetical protein SODALDRAFT_291136 [Sodiomyces alkalinus F11]
MGSLHQQKTVNAIGGDVCVGVIDTLRELGMADKVSLPQLVAVGDQSSGKSSVLESITGFAFPRAPGLCTRYATQITCRRDAVEGIDISIIPRSDSNEARRERLRGFKRSLGVDDLALAGVFAEANVAMGIRVSLDDDDPGSSELTTFSEDILKIEISGPTQQHLTVIDVPGIFRTATENLTTEDDILLVRNMVKRYIADKRTVILAVVPCNVDITTQEVLKLAKDVDPDGLRTLGVLTKPDLATERATQNAVCDLVRGKVHALRLGYYVVKNRGSDDTDNDDDGGGGDEDGKKKGSSSSREAVLRKRHNSEKAFFSGAPWSALRHTNRLGSQGLSSALQILLRAVTKKEFKNVTADLEEHLRARSAELELMGDARNDAGQQRRYLGRVSNEFQTMASCARQSQYARPLFSHWDLRLVTRVVRLLEDFDDAMRTRGHMRNFEGEAKLEGLVPKSETLAGPMPEPPSDYGMFEEILDEHPDLYAILKEVDYKCPEPINESLMRHIEKVYNDSRGVGLGTFSEAVLLEVFKEQSKKWKPLVLSHVSKAILIAHDFICRLLIEVCPDEEVYGQLMDILLRGKLRDAYKRAMDQAELLLSIERHGQLMTMNHHFSHNVQTAQGKRLLEALDKIADGGEPVLHHSYGNHHMQGRDLDSSAMLRVPRAAIPGVVADKSNAELVRQEIHDILHSYYEVARRRFVDVVCQQVVFHLLLDAEDSPLRIFGPDLVMALDETQLEAIAGEELVTRRQREQLEDEVERSKKAVQAVRLGAR